MKNPDRRLESQKLQEDEGTKGRGGGGGFLLQKMRHQEQRERRWNHSDGPSRRSFSSVGLIASTDIRPDLLRLSSSVDDAADEKRDVGRTRTSTWEWRSRLTVAEQRGGKEHEQENWMKETI